MVLNTLHSTHNIPQVHHDTPTVLNIPHGTQDNPHGTHDIPHGTDTPTVLKISPHGTHDIPPRYWTPPRYWAPPQYCTHIIQGGNCLKFSQLGDVALGIGLKNCAFWCRLAMVDAYQSFIFFFWNKVLNHWGKWTNTRDYPGQGIRPYGYHILHQFKKFKIDFCQKNVLHQSASETEKNNTYIILIALAVQKL